MARSDFFDIRQCVCATLRRADRTITQIYDAILAPSGLHITQFTHLYQPPGGSDGDGSDDLDAQSGPVEQAGMGTG